MASSPSTTPAMRRSFASSAAGRVSTKPWVGRRSSAPTAASAPISVIRRAPAVGRVTSRRNPMPEKAKAEKAEPKEESEEAPAQNPLQGIRVETDPGAAQDEPPV